MSVLIDMMINPLLDAAEIEKERDVVLEELRMTNDYPTNRLDLLMDATLWPDQPMGRDVGGTLDSVRNITREQILEYARRQYAPGNAVVTVAGDISHDEVVELLDQELGDWQQEEAISWFPVVDGQDGAPPAV